MGLNNSAWAHADLPKELGGHRLINGNFDINQRGVSGTVILAAGVYGHDRFKAGAGGCTYTFATLAGVTTLTISAGSLQQVIEGVNLITDTYVLSWGGTAQGKIGAGSYSASGVTSAVTGGADLTIEFDTGTLFQTRFEPGDVVNTFIPKLISNILIDCQRYYYNPLFGVTLATNIFAQGQCISGVQARILIEFPVTMRIRPTLTTVGNLRLLSATGTTLVVTSTTVVGAHQQRSIVACGVASGLVAGNISQIARNSDATATLAFDAEI